MGYTPKEQFWAAKHYRMHCRFAAGHYQGTMVKLDMLHPLSVNLASQPKTCH